MASPIDFKVPKIDPRHELQRRLQAAPEEHAESILAALNLLEEAHRKGLLGIAHGALTSKDAIFAKLAEYAKQPESTNALRNLLILGKLLGSIDPDELRCVTHPHLEADTKPPSIWKLFGLFRSASVRKGLSNAAILLGALGSARVKIEKSNTR